MIKNANRAIEWGTDAVLALAVGVCLAMGLLVVVSWHLRLASLLQFGTTLLPGPYVAGWSFLAIGTSLLLVLARRPRAAFLLSLVPVAIVLLTSLQYMHIDTGIDRLAVSLSDFASGRHPVRLSLVATIEFGLAALGVISLTQSDERPWVNAVTAFLGIALVTVALVARVAIEMLRSVAVERVLSLGAIGAFMMIGTALLASAWRNEVRRERDILRWLPAPVTIGLALGTVVLWQTLIVNERLHAQQFIAGETTYIQDKIAADLQSQVLDVVRLAVQWERRDRPNLDKWATDAALTVDRQSGLYALAWFDPALHERRSVPDDQAGLIAAGAKLPHARAALVRAAHGDREPRMSPLIDVGSRHVTYVYVPLRQTRGLFIGMFHPRALLTRALSADVARGFSIEVDAGGRVAYQQHQPELVYPAAWQQSRAFSLYGVDWRVSATPSQAMIRQLRTDVPIVVLIAGLLLSLLTGTALFLAETARLRAADLVVSNRSLLLEIEERRRTAERFRRLLAASPDATLIVNEAGRIVLSNAQAQRLFGYDEQELTGESIDILIPQRFRGVHSQNVRAFIAEPRIRSMGQGAELYGLRRDGQEFPIEISLGPLETEQGILISAAIRDVSERRAREEALRQSEERFRLVIEGVRDYAIFMLDPQGCVVSWNTGAQRIMGYETAEIVGRHFSCFFMDEDREAGAPLRELVAAEREGRVEVEGWRVRKDGTRFWSSVAMSSVHNANGRLVGYAKVTRDISERREHELALRHQTDLIALLQSVAVAANEADNVEMAMGRALARICATTGWPIAHVYLMPGADAEALQSTQWWWCAEPELCAELIAITDDRPFPSGRGVAGRVLERAGPVWSNHLKSVLLPERARAAEHLGMRTVFAFPVLIRARVVGVLEFFTAEITAPDAALIDAMAHIGTQLGRVVERAWSELSVRASETRFRSVTESASDAIVSVDAQGAVVTWNQGATRLFGYAKEDILGQDVRRLLPSTHQARLVALATRDPDKTRWGDVTEIIGRRKDGSEFAAELSLATWREGETRFFSGIVRDATARKQAEARIRDLNETLERRVVERTAQAERARARLAFLAEASRVLASSLDYQATLSQVARLAVPYLAEWCIVDMLDDSEGARRVKIAHADPDKEALAREVDERYPPDPDAKVGPMEVMRTGTPELICEISHDMIKGRDAEHERLLRSLGLRSYICVPLVARGRILGAITFITSDAQRRYDEQDLELAQDLARRAAIAVENARLYEAVQEELRERQRAERVLALRERQQARVAEVGQRALAGIGVDALLDEMVRVVAATLEVEMCKVLEYLPGDERMRLRAGVGWNEGLVGHAEVSAGIESQAGYTLASAEPVIVDDLRAETRFSGPPLLWDHGVISGLSVVIRGRDRPFGVLGAHTRSHRHFSEDDIHFLEAMANVIASAIERQRTEDLLADEKERLAVTLHSIGDGVITTDARGCIVLLNKIAEDLTGWRQAEAEGRPLIDVFHIINEKTREPCENPVEKVLKTGKIIGLANHTALVAKNGKERAIADSGAPIRDRNGRIIGVVLVFRDVTEQQKMEEDLQKSHKLESIGILAGGIAHDFNNILTAILGNISLAKMYSKPGDRISIVLTEAENAFWRARDLTQQLLTFSKGGAPIKKTASVAELLRDTCSFVLSGSNIRCRFEIAPELWPAEFDAGQISQVVNNLLINAQQAMPQGGVITIRAENFTVNKKSALPLAKGRYVKIAIEDQGIGIPEEHLHRVFDPYFTTKQTGSGLGLATSYSIMKRHDGYIDVQSQVGKGTVFTLYLPASRAAIEPASFHAETEPGGHGRILFMDDEETVRRVGGEILVRLGYEVEYATEGTEMLERYAAAQDEGRPFDAVIMDLTIPGGMGGKEAVGKLLELDPNAVAVVSSGYFNDPVMADYARYGFRGVIAKPYKVKELNETLRKALGNA